MDRFGHAKCVKFNINFVTVYIHIEDNPHNFTV